MGRFPSSWMGLLLALLPSVASCSFSKADHQGDAGSSIDVNLPATDGAPAFEADSMPSCVATTPETVRLPPDVLIVLDRSGSMKDQLDGTICKNGCGPNSKWTQMTDALVSFIPTVDTTVNWGLKLFGSSDGAGSCDVTPAIEVAPRATNSTAIAAAIGQALPGSSTPTTAAVTNAASYLSGLADGNPKFILLATDGIPTCGAVMCAPGVIQMGNQAQCDDANAIAAVTAAHDTKHIPTFVIGIGTSKGGGDATLTAMAQAGGFPRAGTPAYYPVESASELTAAFQAITGMVGSCTFSISPALKTNQRITGVKADGTLLPADAFVIVGDSAVQLVGQACTDYTAGTIKTVVVQVDCIG
jgi:hypothetical protein